MLQNILDTKWTDLQMLNDYCGEWWVDNSIMTKNDD